MRNMGKINYHIGRKTKNERERTNKNSKGNEVKDVEGRMLRENIKRL